MAKNEPTEVPLSPLTMAILLALTDDALHGYALMREVERQTGGTLAPGTGSLYAALYRLADEGLIEEAPAEAPAEPLGPDGPAASRPGRPRKRYRITPAGEALARAEANRLEQVLAVATRRLGDGTPQAGGTGPGTVGAGGMEAGGAA